MPYPIPPVMLTLADSNHRGVPMCEICGQRRAIPGRSVCTRCLGIYEACHKTISQDFFDTITALGADATVVNVLRSVEKRHPAAVVRQRYWELLADNRIARSADAHLTYIIAS